MPNKVIFIGGQERPVNFGRNFWGEVELMTGKSTLELLDVRELMSINNQNAIAFCALKWGLYNPNIGREPKIGFSKQNVADWIEQKPDAMIELSNLLFESMPTGKKKEEEGQNESTGTQ